MILIISLTACGDSSSGETGSMPVSPLNEAQSPLGNEVQTTMLQFKHDGQAPTIDEVLALFDLKADEIDFNFGVVGTDPTEGLYVVLVDVSAARRIEAAIARRPKHSAEGLFSNPRIEPTDSSN